MSNANALSLDNETMTNKDGSAKFSDPDEQLEKNFGSSDSQSGGEGHVWSKDKDSILFGHAFSSDNNDKPGFFSKIFDPKK